ncbi:MAG TPA: Rossmann fold nucleotide-binding protein [Nocardioidaceae bacterium]|nr:Rossmann fold nucleotide-binding protein [Nocardioidaceae bacterium]
MRREHGRTVEVETLERFDALAAQAARMDGWRIQGVDLRDRTELLRGLDPCGALLLGCSLTEAAERHVISGGGLVFPELPALPFDAYRARLYTPEELYAGLEESYQSTPDARSYVWSRRDTADIAVTLARGLHDTAVDDALTERLAGTATVGVMGGHALRRDEHGYADAARLGRELARAGLYVATGGGPGAMEAANLGAYLSSTDDAALAHALGLLAPAPAFTPSVGAWAAAAFAVRDRWPDGADSLGIPTWFYGHEPPNAFANDIAKYFQNSLREDTLLRSCDAGIIFLPGAGGTVQEIFQDACENYYAEPSAMAQMVLVGVEHWTRTVPAWPLLAALARDRAMADHIHLVDTVEEVVGLVSP